ncbi:MAG TPA: hypothetical protein VGJ84_17225 [Polyangiaceae bacterium]
MLSDFTGSDAQRLPVKRNEEAGGEVGVVELFRDHAYGTEVFGLWKDQLAFAGSNQIDAPEHREHLKAREPKQLRRIGGGLLRKELYNCTTWYGYLAGSGDWDAYYYKRRETQTDDGGGSRAAAGAAAAAGAQALGSFSGWGAHTRARKTSAPPREFR